MRLTSELFVAALLRTASASGAMGLIAKKGDPGAGAIFLVVDGLDGEAAAYGPAPQALMDEEESGERCFMALHDEPSLSRSEIDALLRSEMRFDPDCWVVDLEDRQMRAFVTTVPRA